LAATPARTGFTGDTLASGEGRGAATALGTGFGSAIGGGVDVRGGPKSVSSCEHVGQLLAPSGLQVSHIPQTTPISRNSFCNVSSRS
jgi:hypothetical protein